MSNEYYDYLGDPFNSDLIASGESLHVQSEEYSGEYNDIVAPSSPNYPVNTPTRYFIELPLKIDQSDLGGSQPIIVKDVTTATVLTRVSGTPGANQYRIAPSTSIRPNVVELHSGQAGNTIGFDYYGEGSILTATNTNQLSGYVELISTSSRNVTNATTTFSFDSVRRNTNTNLFTPNLTNEEVVINMPGVVEVYFDVALSSPTSDTALNLRCVVGGTTKGYNKVFGPAGVPIYVTSLFRVEVDAGDDVEMWATFASAETEATQQLDLTSYGTMSIKYISE